MGLVYLDLETFYQRRSIANGRIARHEAAVHLAHAWDSRQKPARSAARKRRIVDATMAADSLLSWYEAKLASKI